MTRSNPKSSMAERADRAPISRVEGDYIDPADLDPMPEEIEDEQPLEPRAVLVEPPHERSDEQPMGDRLIQSPEPDSLEVDVTSEAVYEGSLFDQFLPNGETVEPELHTDDTNAHAGDARAREQEARRLRESIRHHDRGAAPPPRKNVGKQRRGPAR